MLSYFSSPDFLNFAFIVNYSFSALREEGYNGSNSSDSDDARGNKIGVKIPIERRSYYQAPEKYRKTLRLSSEQIVR